MLGKEFLENVGHREGRKWMRTIGSIFALRISKRGRRGGRDFEDEKFEDDLLDREF